MSCVVIGAGIVGLSTAICLQRKGLQVTIIAEKFGVNTTSHVAGGVFLPYNRNVLGADRREDAIQVVQKSWRHFEELYNSTPQNTGILKMFGYQCYFTKEYGDQLPDTPLVWEVVDKLRSLSTQELKRMSPDTPCSGWVIQTYIIQCQYYLAYLQNKFTEQGGKLVQKRLTSLEEVAGYDVIVNCCGFGAKDLCGDDSVYPAQGQVAHVHAPHIKHFFHCEEVYDKPPEERQLLYMLPQTGHLLIGGTYTEHSDVTLVSEQIRRNFTDKLSHVQPSLPNCELIKQECGVRPARTVLRLEQEEITLNNGRVLKVVHNYGHGGNGVALSWGTAELAVELAIKYLTVSRL